MIVFTFICTPRECSQCPHAALFEGFMCRRLEQWTMEDAAVLWRKLSVSNSGAALIEALQRAPDNEANPPLAHSKNDQDHLSAAAPSAFPWRNGPASARTSNPGPLSCGRYIGYAPRPPHAPLRSQPDGAEELPRRRIDRNHEDLAGAGERPGEARWIREVTPAHRNAAPEKFGRLLRGRGSPCERTRSANLQRSPRDAAPLATSG